MKSRQIKRVNLQTQSGISLITAMVVLVLISMISISNMQGSNTSLAMSNNMHQLNRAFQHAETGIAIALKTNPATTIGTTKNIPTQQSSHYTVSTKYLYSAELAPANFSLGTTFNAHYYEITSVGKEGVSLVTLSRGIRVVGPSTR